MTTGPTDELVVVCMGRIEDGFKEFLVAIWWVEAIWCEFPPKATRK
jgi:hypothetical protein